MSNWLEFLRSEARGKAKYEGHTGAARTIKLRTARGSIAARAVLNKYTPLLKAAETANARRKVEANFAREMKAVENRDLANYNEFMNLLTAHRQTPKRRSAPRPPRPSPRATAARNKLVANLRAELKKLTNVRNNYQRAANRMQAKINAIVASRQRS